MLSGTAGSGGLRRPERDVALGRGPVGLLDGAQPGGDPGLAGGDGLAVASAVGALGQAAGRTVRPRGRGPLARRRARRWRTWTVLAVVASRRRLTVWLSGSRRARAMIRGPSVSGQACSGWPRPCLARSWSSASITSARSIWSQAAAEVLPDRPEVGAPAGAVFHQPGGLRTVRVVAGAGVDAQLGLERRADRSGFGEADQALGEDRCLRPGRQPDGQPPGGDVIDGAAAAVRGGDDRRRSGARTGTGPGAARPRAAGRRVLPEVRRRYLSSASVMRVSGRCGEPASCCW